jgi:DNA polymerase III subunit beta
MDVTVNRDELIQALKQAKGITSKKSTIPVLSTVLLTVRAPDRVDVAATDLYLSLTQKIPAYEVKQEGSACFQAKALLERAEAMPEGPIWIKVDGTTARIKAHGNARKYTLPIIPGEDFPKNTVAEPGASTALSAKTLLDLIRYTVFSISEDETRAHLNGALLEWKACVARMVSTDGHRLSKVEVPVTSTPDFRWLLSLRTVQEIQRLCKAAVKANEDASVNLSQSGSQACFQLSDTRLTARLVDAQFPPYEQVIPQAGEHPAKVERETLISAIKASGVVDDSVRLELTEGQLDVRAEDAENGTAFDTLPATYDGPFVKVGFNARYMLDVLDAIESDEVTLDIREALAPIRIQPVSDRQFLAIVMPVRL